MSARRGMGLLEALVVSALLVMLFGIVYAFLVPGLRAWTRSDAQSQSQQQALLVTSMISREVHYSHPGNLIVKPVDGPEGTSRDAVAFVSSLDGEGRESFDATGSTLWQTILYIYHDGDAQRVRMRRVPITPPTADPPMVDVSAFGPQPDDHIVARNVRSLRMRMLGWEGVLLPLGITVETDVQGRRSSMETAAAPVVLTEPMPSVRFTPVADSE